MSQPKGRARTKRLYMVGFAVLVLALAIRAVFPSIPLGLELAMAMLNPRPAMPAEMRTMCAKDAGVHVYRRVVAVEGYARLPEGDRPTVDEIAQGNVSDVPLRGGCFPCFEELVKERYKYFETYYVRKADQRHEEILNSRRDYYVKKTGLYRYRLVDRSDNPGLCASYDQLKYEALRIAPGEVPYANRELLLFARQYKEFAEQMDQKKCVYAERIEQYSAPYRLRLHENVLEVRGWFGPRGQIHRLRNSIETADGNVIAEAIAYAYVTGESAMSLSDRRCGSLRLSPITEILQPPRTQPQR